ncbi:Thyroid receptor-interacting protein 3 [Fasciola hepatica]|uniref:Zinc finger HIT domain-containing protein 3 n=1 Tax=Fasciola hepatica TaxID=6192 RepID=A0A2H1C3L8_FASHE|nr:Thyroid receptor-interacting protein 3 [Fasciola hepatica]
MSEPRICVVCTTTARYRCPVCKGPYCSVACYKEHKTSNCSSSNSQEQPMPDNFRVPDSNSVTQFTDVETTADYVPIRKLHLLNTSEHLKGLLKNPHLRSYLTKLNHSARPDLLMSAALKEPLFVEFADECLRLINPE